MRKIVYHVATTLDGFICHPDGSVHGFLEQGEHIPDYLDSLKKYDTVLMGRATYEFGYRFGLKPGQLPYPHMKHFVFSRSLKLDEPSEVNIVANHEVEVIQALKEEKGTPIYLCGGGSFAGFLLKHQLIDELIIKLNPVVFGKGIPIFGDIEKSFALELSDSKIYQSGVALMTYRLLYDVSVRGTW